MFLRFGARPDDMARCIVKRFPKGYIVHSYAMQQEKTPCECWMVVEHYGKNENGLEVFLAPSGGMHRSRENAISELRWLRDGVR